MYHPFHQENIIKSTCQNYQEQVVINKYLKKSLDEPTEFGVGDCVLVVSYPTRPPTKVHSRWCDLFIITKRDKKTLVIIRI